MVTDRRLAGAAVFLTLALGVAAAGSGFVNGDAAVYAHQIETGDLSQRWVHLGWILVGSLFAWTGDALPWCLDILCVVAAASLVYSVSRGRGPGAFVAAAGMLGALGAYLGHSEVDLPWLALLVGATLARHPLACSLLAGLAVAISPTALLMVPSILVLKVWKSSDPASDLGGGHRRRTQGAALLGGALVAVALLTVVSRGEWWFGDRGVLSDRSWMVGRNASTLTMNAVPWLIVLPALGGVSRRGLVAFAVAVVGCLAAPSDVPAWLFVSAGLCLFAGRAGLRAGPWGRRLLVAGALIHGALGVSAWRASWHRVTTERVVIQALADSLGPEDGVVAPWSWGVRLSLVRSGEPYAGWWRVPGPPIRDQARQWCAHVPRRVAWLPPGTGQGTTGPSGVRWSEQRTNEGCSDPMR